MESLSGPPSSSIVLRRSFFGYLGRRAGNDGGCPPWWSPLVEEVEGATACSLARVGACADELRLMGVERAAVSTLVGRVGGGVGSLSRNALKPETLNSKPETLWASCYGSDVERS